MANREVAPYRLKSIDHDAVITNIASIGLGGLHASRHSAGNMWCAFSPFHQVLISVMMISRIQLIHSSPALLGSVRKSGNEITIGQ